MVLVLATASQAESQERRDTRPQVNAGTGRIAGTVVDSETGRAVRLADISLTSSAASSRRRPMTPAASRSTNFLRQLMRAAVPITLTEGEKKTQDVRVK